MGSYVLKKFNSVFNLEQVSLLFGVFAWITANVYFLPFVVWTAGIMRPWYMLHGYIPYRDFVWLRMPLDLFLLSGWYSIFGATPQAYQSYVFALLIIIAVSVFFAGRMLFSRFKFLPLVFFIVFLFPLFQNTEEDEMIIGLWAILLLVFMTLFFKKQKVKYLLLAGIISGASLMTKQTSGLLILAGFASILFNSFLRKDTIRSLLTKISAFGLGATIPVIIIVSYFISKNSIGDFLHYTVFFNFGSILASNSTTMGNGLWIIAGYVSLLFPFIMFWKSTKLTPQIIFFITLEILFLFPSLFPSALSYKAFTSYALISIVAGCDILLLFSLKKHKKIVLLSFVFFLIFIRNFISSYFSGNPGFSPNQLLQDFGKKEYEIANLIKKNTNKNDKIINYGSEMIYLLSDRLPKNKYVDPFPQMLQPFDVSLKVFVDNPPKIIVYDQSLPNDQPGLEKWPGLIFFKQNYNIIAKYDSLVILEYNYK